MKFPFVRNLEAENFSLNFLVAALVTILVTRLFLHLTGYPKVGGEGLHIAHMLWGGLGMLIAILILINYLNKTAHYFAAILGGIGFGLFIDELGKFITHNNDYFFKPTIALIYVIFILLYLALHLIERKRRLSQTAYLANAYKIVQEAVVRELTRDEKARIRSYLKFGQKQDPYVTSAKELIGKIKAAAQNPSFFSKWERKISRFYVNVAESENFYKFLIVVFAVTAILSILESVIFTDSVSLRILHQHTGIGEPQIKFEKLGADIFSAVSAVFIIIGIFNLKRSKIFALRMFRVAVLVSIFLTQFFVFYDVQFEALWGFALDLLILLALNIMIRQEISLNSAL